MYYLIMTQRTESFTLEVLPPHLDYLATLRESGCLKLSGGFTDKSGGAYLISCDSRAEAERIAQEDPLISSGASTALVREWDAK